MMTPHELQVTTCCLPACWAPVSERIKHPLCDRHAVGVYRDVVRLLTASKPEPREMLPDSHAAPSAAFPLRSDRARGVVYFVRFGDRVKIGFTTNLRRRMAVVPHDEVLATTPGTMRDEQAIHRRFKDSRINGEWFAITRELLDLIEGLKAA